MLGRSRFYKTLVLQSQLLLGNLTLPYISSAPNIGTQLTATPGLWTGNPTLTYKWQRYVSAAWTDISGATNVSYTPVDADWGYPLRVVEIPNDNLALAVTSISTVNVRKLPVTGRLAERLTNPTFSSWSSDDPVGWPVFGESAGVRYIEQCAPDGSVGTGALHFYRASGDSTNIYAQQSGKIELGKLCELIVTMPVLTQGTVSFNAVKTFNSIVQGTTRYLGKATYANAALGANAPGGNFVLTQYSIKYVSLDVQQVAPSADMIVDAYFTLPVTPVKGDKVYLPFRISDFDAGNFLLVEYEYTGSQWNATLYSVASNVLSAAKASATNVGTLDGIRVSASGSTIKMYKTSGGDGLWTQMGVTATVTDYQTATGVNIAATTGITLSTLAFTNP